LPGTVQEGPEAGLTLLEKYQWGDEDKSVKIYLNIDKNREAVVAAKTALAESVAAHKAAKAALATAESDEKAGNAALEVVAGHVGLVRHERQFLVRRPDLAWAGELPAQHAGTGRGPNPRVHRGRAEEDSGLSRLLRHQLL